VGSGISGVVALIVSVRVYSTHTILGFIMSYPHKIFKANIFTKVGFWIKYKPSTKKSNSHDSDGKIIWHDYEVDRISQTTNTDAKAASEYKSKNIFYARLNPEINFTLHFDATFREELQTLYHCPTEYLAKSNDYILSTCRRLVASLLYIAGSKIRRNGPCKKLLSFIRV
jgi:hypothetical protein